MLCFAPLPRSLQKDDKSQQQQCGDIEDFLGHAIVGHFDVRDDDRFIAIEVEGFQLIFELRGSTTRSGRFVADGPSLGRLSSTSDETSRFEMNIWSSSQDSILGGRFSEREGRTFSSFEIEAVLRERSLGEVVWEGRAIVETDGGQAEPYVPQMVESLVRSLGQTVRERTFPVF